MTKLDSARNRNGQAFTFGGPQAGSASRESGARLFAGARSANAEAAAVSASHIFGAGTACTTSTRRQCRKVLGNAHGKRGGARLGPFGFAATDFTRRRWHVRAGVGGNGDWRQRIRRFWGRAACRREEGQDAGQIRQQQRIVETMRRGTIAHHRHSTVDSATAPARV